MSIATTLKQLSPIEQITSYITETTCKPDWLTMEIFFLKKLPFKFICFFNVNVRSQDTTQSTFIFYPLKNTYTV